MFLLLMLTLALRSLYLHMTLSHFELIRRSGTPWVHLELRRHALVSRMENDLQEFPSPREVRVWAVRVLGIPVWRELRSVGLPPQLEARIDDLRAEEVDHLFNGIFQLRAAVV